MPQVPAIVYEVSMIFECGGVVVRDYNEPLRADLEITRMINDSEGFVEYEYEDGRTEWKCVTRKGKDYYFKWYRRGL